MAKVSLSDILNSYNNAALALYRFPHQEQVHFILDDHAIEDSVDLNEFNGFVMKAFDRQSFLGIQNKYSGNFDSWEQSFEIDFQECTAVEGDDDQFVSEGLYKETILDALDNIEKGHFSKVVLSRPLYTESISYHSAQLLFEKLTEGYPHAFLSLVKHPNGSIWIGASPEVLLEVKGEEIRTCSLAGTKWEESVKWTEKEIREQSIVTDYIIEKLETEFADIELDVKGPYTHPSGHLFHLKTDINIRKVNDFNALVKLLHPTPAICGQPKGNSLDFIRLYEGYDRKFYSGFLGPINMENSSHLFVNLRCAELFDEGASIYVGGGIVKRSNPDKEWEETKQKAQIIMNLLKS